MAARKDYVLTLYSQPVLEQDYARPGLEPAKPKDTAITRTYCRQKGKIHYVTPKPLSHPVSNQSERKGLFYIYSERRGDCSKGK